MLRRGLAETLLTVFVLFIFSVPSLAGEGGKTILFHLKTSLKQDDSQICVAYNMIWAALDDGLDVKVLIDADAVNTFRVGWFGKDDIEDFSLPERLRRALAEQFDVEPHSVPRTYGGFIKMLHRKGAEFYINTAFLVLAKIEKRMGSVENVSEGFFKPVTLKEMLELVKGADYYMVY